MFFYNIIIIIIYHSSILIKIQSIILNVYAVHLSMKYLYRLPYIIYCLRFQTGFKQNFFKKKRVDFSRLFIIGYQKGPSESTCSEQSTIFSEPKLFVMSAIFFFFFTTLKSITLVGLILINLSRENSFKVVFCVQ